MCLCAYLAHGVRRDRDTRNQREEFAVLHRETECAVHPTPHMYLIYCKKLKYNYLLLRYFQPNFIFTNR